MTPELLEKLSAEIPADLCEAFRAHGYAKVAHAALGVPTSEYDVYAKIGEDIFRRKAEQGSIGRGLRALAALED